MIFRISFPYFMKMLNIKKFYFFRCYHCGEWYYSSKRIKQKKCWKCNKSFKFKNSSKFSKECTTREAIEIIKALKEKETKEKSSLLRERHFLRIDKFDL